MHFAFFFRIEEEESAKRCLEFTKECPLGELLSLSLSFLESLKSLGLKAFVGQN